MQRYGNSGGHQRVCPVQDEKLDEPRRNLCWPNQCCGGDSRERRRAGAARAGPADAPAIAPVTNQAAANRKASKNISRYGFHPIDAACAGCA